MYLPRMRPQLGFTAETQIGTPDLKMLPKLIKKGNGRHQFKRSVLHNMYFALQFRQLLEAILEPASTNFFYRTLHSYDLRPSNLSMLQALGTLC